MSKNLPMAKKILVIDDDQGILDAFEAMLETYGYDVKTESNGESIYNTIKSFPPDLILLDVLLSGQDGRDICKMLKAHKMTKKIPVIMISAHPGIQKSIKEAGADDFISKPFEMDYLLDIIKRNSS